MDRNERVRYASTVRELMCYCEFCLYENCDDDLNKDYVSNWEERVIEGKLIRVVVV